MCPKYRPASMKTADHRAGDQPAINFARLFARSILLRRRPRRRMVVTTGAYRCPKGAVKQAQLTLCQILPTLTIASHVAFAFMERKAVASVRPPQPLINYEDRLGKMGWRGARILVTSWVS